MLDKAIDDLVLNADLQELTARPYIVGHLCKSLAPLVVAAVCLLWHVHEFPNRDHDDEKLSGVYRTEQDAVAAIDRVRNQPGFREFQNGFQIVCYELNKDNWQEGFITV